MHSDTPSQHCWQMNACEETPSPTGYLTEVMRCWQAAVKNLSSD